MSGRADPGSIDRISDLPDELLSRILSLIATKNAVATSVLSSRWRYLFISVSSLDFSDSLFLYPQRNKCRRDRIHRRFMDFVDRVLFLLNRSTIERISLTCGKGVDPTRVDSWICDFTLRGIQELSLCLSLCEGYMLPIEIFSCKSLVVLKLGSKVALDLPPDFCLPSLKTLYLDSIILDDDVFCRLLSGCILLEDLVIKDLDWEYLSGCYISVVTLKRLCVRIMNNDLSALDVAFHAQNLTYLEYSDQVADEYLMMCLDSLVEAHIDLQLTEKQIKDSRYDSDSSFDDDESIAPDPGDATELIRGIKNVHSLYLSADSVEVIPLCCTAMPVFSNLTYLFIESYEGRGWQALPDILRNSSNLETLVFDGILHHVSDRCGEACNCSAGETMKSCLLSCPLKTIEILSFEGHEKEVKLIEYFLKNTPWLDKMMIYSRIEGEELSDVTECLQMLPRASTNCSIDIALYSERPLKFAIDPKL